MSLQGDGGPAGGRGRTQLEMMHNKRQHQAEQDTCIWSTDSQYGPIRRQPSSCALLNRRPSENRPENMFTCPSELTELA